MARDPNDIVIAGNGDVNLAPVGTILPTNADDALDAAFSALGYVSEDGVTFSPNTSTEGIPAWQSLVPVRTVVTDSDFQLSFELMEWTENTLIAAFGGGLYTDNGDGTWDFQFPLPEEIGEFAMVIDALDGPRKYRLVFERVQLESTGDVTFQSSDDAGLPTVMRALAGANGRPGVIYGSAPFTP